VTLLVLAGVALGDKVDDLIKRLKDPDNKVRLSAALSLGKLGDKRAIPPLTAALSDSDKTVRGVAAAALGKLVDATVDPKVRDAAIGALERVAKNDPDAFVRSQAQKSYDALKPLQAKPGGGTGPSAGLGGKKIFVQIGAFSDATSKDKKMVDLARKTIEKSVPKDMATQWPGGKAPTGTDLSKAGVKGFTIDGTINKFEVKKSGANATVICWVSMYVATFPENSAFGYANNKKAEVDTGSSDKEVAEAKEYCVEALVGGLVKDSLVPAIKARAP
jgi:hypothetical protein